ncbi:MAG: bifunctional 4-hydroxy-2-oxoglutarate aldolase/2-dehydro-3-deoxy-phosphogluconate aldolase [Hyphomonadaceae bacterium]
MTGEEALRLAAVLPVLTIERVEDAVPLARAILEGGLPAVEITLRTPVALQAMEAVARGAPELRIGAGTVLNAQDLRQSIDAGARFALSPGFAADIPANAAIPYIPGVATASEVMRGLAAGFTAFKFFPAASMGGAATLGAYIAPMPQALFCPTGGVTLESAAKYLALSNVLCVGGSWIAPLDTVRARDWAKIRANAAAAAQLKK